MTAPTETLPPTDAELARVRGAVFTRIAERAKARRRSSIVGAVIVAAVVIGGGTAGGIAVKQANMFNRNYSGLCYYSPAEVGHGPLREMSVAQPANGPALDGSTLHSLRARIGQITSECNASYRLEFGGDAADMNPSLISVPPITACQEPDGTLAAIVNRKDVPVKRFCDSVGLAAPHD